MLYKTWYVKKMELVRGGGANNKKKKSFNTNIWVTLVQGQGMTLTSDTHVASLTH